MIYINLLAFLGDTGKCDTKNDKWFEGTGKRDFGTNGFVSLGKDLGESDLLAIV